MLQQNSHQQQHSIQLLAQQQLQHQQAQLEQAGLERPAQQRPAQPSLNEPMRVAIPQQVAIGTNPCSWDCKTTKPKSPDPTWAGAQMPTMEVLPAAAMSEQLPTMQAPETVSETSVEADPNLLAATGAHTLVAAARPIVDLAPPGLEARELVVPNPQEQQQQQGSVVPNPQPQGQQQQEQQP